MCEHILINTPSGLWKTPSTPSSESVSPQWACYPTLCNHTAWLSLPLSLSLHSSPQTTELTGCFMWHHVNGSQQKVLRGSGMYMSQAAVQRDVARVLEKKTASLQLIIKKQKLENWMRDMMLLLRSSQGRKKKKELRYTLNCQVILESYWRSSSRQLFESCRGNNEKSSLTCPFPPCHLLPSFRLSHFTSLSLLFNMHT